MAAAEPARRRRRGRSATPTRRAALGVDDEETAAWRDAADGDARSPTTRSSASTRSPRASPSHAALGLRAHAAGPVPAAAALPLLRPLPQAGRQAGRPRARDAPARRRVHRRGEGAQLRLLRAAHRARLVAVGLHAGGHRGRGRPPRAGLRLLRRGRADGPRTTSSTTPATALHIASLAGAWIAAVAGFGGMRDHDGRFSLRPAAARRTSSASPSGSCCAAAGCASRSCRARRRYELLDGEPLELRHDDTPFTLERGESAGARVARAAGRRAAVAAPASRAHPAAAARVRLTAGAVLRWLDRGLPPPQARRKTLPGPRLRGVFLVRPRP